MTHVFAPQGEGDASRDIIRHHVPYAEVVAAWNAVFEQTRAEVERKREEVEQKREAVVSAVSARFSTPGGTAPLPGPRANTPVPAEAAGQERHNRAIARKTKAFSSSEPS